MTTTSTPKSALSFTTRNGAKVEAVRLSNERYNRNYAIYVNGTKVAVLSNRGRGRYSWPAFEVYSDRSFLGNLDDAVRSIISGTTNFHVAGCFGDISNQIEAGRSSDKGDLDWDFKCDCGKSSAATQESVFYNDLKAVKARKAEAAAKHQEIEDSRRALYGKVRAALVEALDIDAEDADDDADTHDGIQWLYATDVTLNDDAVEHNKVQISLTGLAKILGIS